jgi:NTE family protein
MNFKLIGKTAFVTILFATSLLAQSRPKVGVVLSGGGAKGLAHVGVLKVLEREGVPIDYITGTSMGSIVGGLYAIGYSVEDLERIVENINWEEVFSGNVHRNDLSFDNKVWDSRYMVTLPMRDGKIRLPSGIIGDQPILDLLTFYTIPAHHISDFHKLAIPFACIGADIVTGEAVILDHGYLAEAIRASMSLPSIPGQVPNPAELPSGCPFHPRCDFSIDRCSQVYPEWVVDAHKHACACHLEIKNAAD